MSVSLSFGNYSNYSVSEARLTQLIDSDKKSATKLSVWEYIQDLFRPEKKSVALNTLYELLHSERGSDKLDAFNKLKSFCEPAYQERFSKTLVGSSISFSIGDYPLASCTLQDVMNLEKNTPLYKMSPIEGQIFLSMLDTLREGEQPGEEQRPEDLRHAMSDLYGDVLSALYRPGEEMNSAGTEWLQPEVISEDEKKLLMCLNSGNFNQFSQFSRMGYQQSDAGVEFSMIHPSINYLLRTYTRMESEFLPIREINSRFMEIINDDYLSYFNDKEKIDNILSRIYHAHGDTLNISYLDQNRNRLLAPGK